MQRKWGRLYRTGVDDATVGATKTTVAMFRWADCLAAILREWYDESLPWNYLQHAS